jgi:3'-phosphoadenosine 5'-phosphosulfate sulfotransferase (PAPS reductase)/FAD synthetase
MKEDKRLAFQKLERKVEKSVEIILEAEKAFGHEKIGVLWTGCRNSMVLLQIIKTAYEGEVPFRVLTIELSPPFDELRPLRERLVREWNLEAMVLTLPCPQERFNPTRGDWEGCLFVRKAALERSGIEHGIRAWMTPTRWGEHEANADERYFSPEKEWVKINPLLHFMEKDIGEYLRKHPFPLELGARQEGLWPKPCEPPFSSIGGEERKKGGKDEAAFEKARIIEKLKSLGYF